MREDLAKQEEKQESDPAEAEPNALRFLAEVYRAPNTEERYAKEASEKRCNFETVNAHVLNSQYFEQGRPEDGEK